MSYPRNQQRADSKDPRVSIGTSGRPASQPSLTSPISTRDNRQSAGNIHLQAGATPPPSTSKAVATSQLASGGRVSQPAAARVGLDRPERSISRQAEGSSGSVAPISAAKVSNDQQARIEDQRREGHNTLTPPTLASTAVTNGPYVNREIKPGEVPIPSFPPNAANPNSTGLLSNSAANSATAGQRGDHNQGVRRSNSVSQSPATNPVVSAELRKNGNVQAEGPSDHIPPAVTSSATNGQHASIRNGRSHDPHGSVLSSSAANPNVTGRSTGAGIPLAEGARSSTTVVSANPVMTGQISGTENKQARGAGGSAQPPPPAVIPVPTQGSNYVVGTAAGHALGPGGTASHTSLNPVGNTKVKKPDGASQPPDNSQVDDVIGDPYSRDLSAAEDSQSELVTNEEFEKGTQRASRVSKASDHIAPNSKPTIEGSVHQTFKTLRFPKLWGKGLGRRNSSEVPPTRAGGNLKENDIIIAITGTLGEKGKRLFVDAVVGDEKAARHIVESSQDGRVHCTTFPHTQDSNRNVVLVYVPSDEKLADSLKTISTWLAQSSMTEKNIAGIIYLEDIANSRPLKSSQKDHKTLEKYLRASASVDITFATTGWDKVKHEIEEQREKEVRERWKAFVQRGAGIIRFDASSESAQAESAQAIVGPLISTADDKTIDRSRKVYKGKESKLEDIFMVDPRSTDIVIPIMGPTGVGKSTFINTVAGEAVATVGHNLKSQTAQLQHVVLLYPKDRNRRIILVDTPGFDDTYVSDSEILRRIAVWLAKSYSANMKLSGVVYMHEISQTRMLGTSLKNLEMFQKLCGEEGMKNVILATTKWSEVPPEVGQRREQQLMERHWKPMLELGSELRRFTDSQQSGWDIIDRILKNVTTAEATDAVAIQEELVEIDKFLPETEAGQMLRYTLEELLESQKQTAAQLRDDEANPELRTMLEENSKKISATVQQLRTLNIPFKRRIKNFFLQPFDN